MRLSIYKILIITLCSVVLTLPTKAQQYQPDWEYGMWVGISNYFGDINTTGSFEFLGPGAGIFARYNMSSRFAFKTGFNYGIISARDAAIDNPWQQRRNLSFKSNIIEWSSHIEFNFFEYNKRREEKSFTPYLLTGISFFYFNPTADFEGERYSLQPIGTEGQNTPESEDGRYLRLSVAIPFGGGFKYSFNPIWAIGVEVGLRKTLTDYIDDVSTVYPAEVFNFVAPADVANALSDRSSEVGEAIGSPGAQRGDPAKKDAYLFAGLTLSYTILKTKCPRPSSVR